jgi:hypothetical protein
MCRRKKSSRNDTNVARQSDKPGHKPGLLFLDFHPIPSPETNTSLPLSHAMAEGGAGIGF